MSLFSSLNTSVTGMNASQVQLATTSHNISNINNDHYTRQRVSTSARYTDTGNSINPGCGVQIDNVIRIHDEFVFGRLKTSNSNSEYSSMMKQTLEEIGQYFPDLLKVGIKHDMENFFNAWSAFASNPEQGAQKVNLITVAQTLTANIRETRNKMQTLQNTLNDQLKVHVEEINKMGQKIANINRAIADVEFVQPTMANDLRDQRDKLELSLAKLLNINVYKEGLHTNSPINVQITDGGVGYHLNIAGVSLVDGSTFHPITIDNTKNPSGFYEVYSVREDGNKYNLTSTLSGGKLGAILDLRGREIIAEEKGGYPRDGMLQGYIDQLDTFAKSFIVNVNNIYAQAASPQMQSDPNEGLMEDTPLMVYDRSIQKGDFDINIYDTDGKVVATKKIFVNETTTMEDVVRQINSNTDDNNDNDTTNDVNDFFRASFNFEGFSNGGNGVFTIDNISTQFGYTIAIKDNGTNFPGVIGVKSFLSGSDATDMKVHTSLVEKPDSLQGSGAPTSGDNSVANAMMQLQYDKIKFFNANGTVSVNTLEGYYRYLTTDMASDAEQNKIRHDTNSALLKTVTTQFQSISGVNLDEELADLMRFQTAFASSAKVVSTIDKMLDALIAMR